MKVRIVARFKNENFIQARLAMGFTTQAEMARETGISAMTICESENFRYYPKRKGTRRRFEEALKCPIEYIFPIECREVVDRKLGRPIERVLEFKELPPYMERNLLLPSPEKIYDLKELEEELESVLHLLTNREATILKMRFGIFGEDESSFQEIADRFGVTKERIRQIEAKALRRLHHPSRSRNLNTFLY